MPPTDPNPKPNPLPDYKAIAAQYAAAKKLKDAEDASRSPEQVQAERKRQSDLEILKEALDNKKKANFERRWWWTVGFWTWMLCIHAVGIGYFTSGFLLTRLVLDEKSECAVTPLNSSVGVLPNWPGKGTVDGGCWHPKTFDKAVVILIDALRYDFTVPVEDDAAFHNAFPFLYKTAVEKPNNAFLRPFIADPPTATLQRLKGLTTGTLPTFVDLGSNFAGSAIEEDNILMQLRDAGKRIVHLGDDTWDALFPGYFEADLSHPYPSLEVHDLHTVDNGVLEHIFPLMERTGEWDMLIGHFLGVDHAGHRYGPEHKEMTKKLQQMDRFIQQLVETIDDDTVLVVMGDHGMDSKGDHGGESDDEIEAALWMYSKKPVFGRTNADFVTPPANAKIRPVNQIDLVPTLSLLLGIPIPYNNLGQPITEAFIGPRGDAWGNLAAASRMSAAGIKRYQASYFDARGINQAATPGSPNDFWNKAEASATVSGKPDWPAVYAAFATYQDETLALCKSLWARFDLVSMFLGICIMALGVLVLSVYVSRDGDDDDIVVDNIELDLAEQKLELEGVKADAAPYQGLDKSLVRAAFLGAAPGIVGGIVRAFFSGTGDYYRGAGFAAITSGATVTATLLGAGKSLKNLLPTSFFGWLAVLFTVLQSAGFAANSFTIWEDSILLFFTTTFGLASAVYALRLPSLADRYMAIYHSVLFALLGRVASYSKLCREEQMPYCTSTYYASATSSTSAGWQLAIPLTVFIILPSIIKAYLVPTRSYEGLAPTWIGYVFRTGLFMSAAYWTLDAANNGNWIPGLPEQTLKSVSVYLAQIILGLALVAGTTAFIWAPPCVSISTQATKSGRAQVTILGYGNANGARYLLLPLNLFGACFLLSKPMGGGALALMLWQIMSLVEILDLNALTASTIGPIMLALLGNFYYFKTGHQAALSSIQWDSAFIPLFTIRYPWSPIVITLNTFGGQILAATALPLLVLWKTNPKRKGTLDAVSRALGVFVSYFAVEALATMMWAGHLRRHLMLYRVFCPRFMLAAVLLVVVDLVGILVALTGTRSNTRAVSEVFGWSE
ncbi:GPI ethanolamine phosphate transferase 3-like protein [Coniochaeta sp. 2T2.1]|nr:GPI ethanolamine phosphate transferase 3-like protein [Coniochaeta sp. 2T2.1]